MRQLREPGILYLACAILIAIIIPGRSNAENPQVKRHIDSGNYETAYQLLLEELDQKLNDENSLYLLGFTASNGTRSSLFLKEYLQKHIDGVNSDKARRRLLDYYAAAGLQITAARLYDDESGSAAPQDLYRAAVIKQQLGQLNEASELFETTLKSSDGDLAGWCLLGIADCELLNENYRQAEKRYKEYFDKYPDSPSFPFSLIGLSETYRRMGDLDRAATYYQLYRERYESSPGSDEIKAAILEDDSKSSKTDIPSILDVDYFVQVGVFAKKDNAKRCVRNFRIMGYRSKMEKFAQGGKSFYRALIGPYGNEQQASREKLKLEKSQGEEYLIILQ